MDRRGFVTSSMAAGLVGTGSLGTLLARMPGWGYGKTDVNGNVRLSANENPLGLAPTAREAVIEAIVDANRYGGRRELVLDELAGYLGVGTENITLGFGSTEILQVATQAFQGPNTPLIAAAPTFEDVMDYQDTMPFEVTTIPLTADLQHDIGRMREAASHRPSLVYICNPNNPTGTVTASDDIDAWIADAPETTTFLIDEAYLEYVTDPRFRPAIDWIHDHPNVVVIRTFSKIFGMAGLRLGYAVSHPSTAARLNEHTIQNSPNVLAGAAAIASLRDERGVEGDCAHDARRTRPRVPAYEHEFHHAPHQRLTVDLPGSDGRRRPARRA
jgi:histidinol-phosphate aminotransferase